MHSLVIPRISQMDLPINQHSLQILSSYDANYQLAINFASFTAASGVPGQGNHTSSTLRTYLNPVEAQMLANYLEQHRRQWLSRRNFWAHLSMYEVPWQQEHGSDVPR